MENNNLKFIIGGLIIIAAMIWLGISGFEEGKAYYKTVEEIQEMGDDVYGKRLKVAGDVVMGSIKQNGRHLSFAIEQNGNSIPVTYTGDALIPDTFTDGVQAVIEGTFTTNGVFEAKHIQAKCASKYEAEFSANADSI